MPSSRQVLHDLVKNNLRLDKAHSTISASGMIKSNIENIIIIPNLLINQLQEPIKESTVIIERETLIKEEVILDDKQEVLEELEIQTVETDIKPFHREKKKFGKEKKIKE